MNMDNTIFVFEMTYFLPGDHTRSYQLPFSRFSSIGQSTLTEILIQMIIYVLVVKRM